MKRACLLLLVAQLLAHPRFAHAEEPLLWLTESVTLLIYEIAIPVDPFGAMRNQVNAMLGGLTKQPE